MEQLTTIEYKGKVIRVYGAKHDPWFSAEDVAVFLGYETTVELLRKVDVDDKVDRLINEFGLFTLLSAGKDAVFKRLFSQEVLPQLHKRGQYKEKKEKRGRLHTLPSGEKASKDDLIARAISLGMQRTEAKRSSVAVLINYIDEKEVRLAEIEFAESIKSKYPYDIEDMEEISYGNIQCLMHILPNDSYIQANGKMLFNDCAVEAIKSELAKWT